MIKIFKKKLREKQEAKEVHSKTFSLSGLLFLSVILTILIIPNVMAHCPLCTAATVFGVGVTRSLGWDDSIVGVFVGAMIISSALWLNNILKKRNIGGNTFLRICSITFATLALTILTFYFAGIFGPANSYRIFGMEKIIFGTLSGALVSFAAFFISNAIKKKNNGKVLFNYQTIALTFSALIVNALIFWAVFR